MMGTDDNNITHTAPSMDVDNVERSPVVKALREHFQKYNGEAERLFVKEVATIKACRHVIMIDTCICMHCNASAELIEELKYDNNNG